MDLPAALCSKVSQRLLLDRGILIEGNSLAALCLAGG